MHQFEELKKKLDAEGLFAQDSKKPVFPLNLNTLES
jgi:exonuclease VII large subunit